MRQDMKIDLSHENWIDLINPSTDYSSLDISCKSNQLADKNSEELIKIFTIIFDRINEQNLRRNESNNKCCEVVELNLGYNFFGLKEGEVLAQFFATFPATVTTLNLRETWLGVMGGKGLMTAFSAIPLSVISLDLSCNYLRTLSGKELAQSFSAMRCRLRSLDLSRNRLGDKKSVDLKEAFSALPAGLSSLNLSQNRLFLLLSGEELAEVLTAIPASVTSLNLTDNMLHCPSLQRLKGLLPQVKTLTVSYEEINAMSLEQRQAFKAIFPNINHVIFIDKDGKEMENDDACARDNLLRSLGFETSAPSLFRHCSFFIKNNKLPIPHDLTNHITELHFP